MRALQKKRPIPVRNKVATRPWQHVLEPLSGYLRLASVLLNPPVRCAAKDKLDSAFNFGPGHESNRTVADLVQEVLKHWPGKWEDQSDSRAVHEAKLLQLSTDKANALLGWSPVWTFSEAIAQTVSWYRADQVNVIETTKKQIAQYSATALDKHIFWTQPSLNKQRTSN